MFSDQVSNDEIECDIAVDGFDASISEDNSLIIDSSAHSSNFNNQAATLSESTDLYKQDKHTTLENSEDITTKLGTFYEIRLSCKVKKS